MGQRQGWIQQSYDIGKGREGQRVFWGLILEAEIFAKSFFRWALLLQDLEQKHFAPAVNKIRVRADERVWRRPPAPESPRNIRELSLN